MRKPCRHGLLESLREFDDDFCLIQPLLSADFFTFLQFDRFCARLFLSGILKALFFWISHLYFCEVFMIIKDLYMRLTFLTVSSR